MLCLDMFVITQLITRRTKQFLSDATFKPECLLYLPASVGDQSRGMTVPGLLVTLHPPWIDSTGFLLADLLTLVAFCQLRPMSWHKQFQTAMIWSSMHKLCDCQLWYLSVVCLE